MSRFLMSIILLIAGICLFVFAIGRSDVLKIAESLKILLSLNLLWIFLLAILSVIMGGIRWYLILKDRNSQINLFKVLWAKFVGFAFSYITPVVFLGGEPVRYLVLKEEEKKLKLEPSVIIASIIIDKLIFLVFSAIVFFIGFFLLVYYLKISFVWETLVILAAFVVFVVLPITVSRLKKRLKKEKKGVLNWLLEKLYLRKIKFFKNNHSTVESIEREIFHYFQKKKNFFLVFSLAALEIVLVLLVFWLIIKTIERPILPGKILAINSLLQLSYIFPTPGALGSFELSQSFGFQSLGLSSGKGVAFSLALRGVNLIIVILGMFLFLWFQFRLIKRKFLKLIEKISYEEEN